MSRPARRGPGLLAALVALAVLLLATGPVASDGGYQGFGATTPGGAGGAVVQVTNLNDSGPGSLRDAVSAGNRTVVFDVAGSILLLDHLYVRGAFVTIDGLSAPPPGITLVGRGLVIRGTEGAHDVIVRGLRVRDSIADNIQVAYGAYNVVIDHVSSHGAGDGNLDITYDARDVTVAWSILSAPSSGKSMLIKYNASRISLHHNAFILGHTRNPSASVDDAGTPATDTTLDMRNNIVWEWGNGYGTFIHHGARANVVANFYSSPGSVLSEQREALVVCQGECFGGDPLSLARGYVAGNVSGDPLVGDLDAESTEGAPFPAPWVDALDACNAAHDVLAGAGVRPLDATDTLTLALVVLPPCSPLPTVTTLASSVSPSQAGEAVTLTATVTATDPWIIPAGPVTFVDGQTPLATVELVDGTASHTTTSLGLGTHAITAVYEGGGAFTASASTPLSQVVQNGITDTVLAGPPASTVFGQPATFTAIVTSRPPGSDTPTGVVTFFDGPTALTTVTLAGGAASFTTAALPVGSHAITAAYGGGAGYAGSGSNSVAHAVQRGETATALVSSANPVRPKTPVTFTVTVTPVAPAAGMPTGTIRFLKGTTVLATVTLSGGTASYTTTKLTAGSHLITAQYSGSASFTASAASLTQVIKKGL